MCVHRACLAEGSFLRASESIQWEPSAIWVREAFPGPGIGSAHKRACMHDEEPAHFCSRLAFRVARLFVHASQKPLLSDLACSHIQGFYERFDNRIDLGSVDDQGRAEGERVEHVAGNHTVFQKQAVGKTTQRA